MPSKITITISISIYFDNTRWVQAAGLGLRGRIPIRAECGRERDGVMGRVDWTTNLRNVNAMYMCNPCDSQPHCLQFSVYHVTLIQCSDWLVCILSSIGNQWRIPWNSLVLSLEYSCTVQNIAYSVSCLQRPPVNPIYREYTRGHGEIKSTSQ